MLTQRVAMIWEKMAGATGLEPATFGVTGRRSNQLSYAPAGVLRGLRKGGPMYVPGGRSVKDGRLCRASMYPKKEMSKCTATPQERESRAKNEAL